MGAPTIAGLSVTVAFSSSAAVPSLGGEGKVSRGAWPALSPVLPRDSSSLGRHVNVDRGRFLHRPLACPDPAALAGSGREASHGLWSPSAALRLQPRSPGTMTSYASRRLTEGAPQLQGPSPTPPTCRLRGPPGLSLCCSEAIPGNRAVASPRGFLIFPLLNLSSVPSVSLRFCFTARGCSQTRWAGGQAGTSLTFLLWLGRLPGLRLLCPRSLPQS